MFLSDDNVELSIETKIIGIIIIFDSVMSIRLNYCLIPIFRSIPLYLLNTKTMIMIILSLEYLNQMFY